MPSEEGERLVWEVSGLTLFEDDSIYVDLHLYDYITGTDIITDPVVITCSLHAGGPFDEGSVYFFRYP
jgi:hypothetical protein